MDWVLLYVATWRDAYSFAYNIWYHFDNQYWELSLFRYKDAMSFLRRWWRQLEIVVVRTLFLNSYMDHMPPLHLPFLPTMTFIRLMPWLQISFTWPNGTVVWCSNPPQSRSLQQNTQTISCLQKWYFGGETKDSTYRFYIFSYSSGSILLHGGDLQHLTWLGLQWTLQSQRPEMRSWLQQLFPLHNLETSKLDSNAPESICLLDLEVQGNLCRVTNFL